MVGRVERSETRQFEKYHLVIPGQEMISVHGKEALPRKIGEIRMNEIIPIETITSRIYLIRGMKIMLDFDLAGLYQVETRALKQAVRRNSKRFPEDFMFVLTNQEVTSLRSQIVTSSWGGTRYPPMAFTEQGVDKNAEGRM